MYTWKSLNSSEFWGCWCVSCFKKHCPGRPVQGWAASVGDSPSMMVWCLWYLCLLINSWYSDSNQFHENVKMRKRSTKYLSIDGQQYPSGSGYAPCLNSLLLMLPVCQFHTISSALLSLVQIAFSCSHCYRVTSCQISIWVPCPSCLGLCVVVATQHTRILHCPTKTCAHCRTRQKMSF